MRMLGCWLLRHLAHNVLQLGAVCVGLWGGNCAKVLLCVCKIFNNYFLRGLLN